MIAGNHASLLDPPLLAAFMPENRCLQSIPVVNGGGCARFLGLVDAFPA